MLTCPPGQQALSLIEDGSVMGSSLKRSLALLTLSLCGLDALAAPHLNQPMAISSAK
jgi:hypothetical protein